MHQNPYAVTFSCCDWQDIHELVSAHLIENKITIDSYWEDNVLACNHYQMVIAGKTIGCFSIHSESAIWVFIVLPEYANLAQELFVRVKKYEKITQAMVATGDEHFLSLCLDSFARIEKQANFSIYTVKPLPEEKIRPITLRLADIEKDMEILKFSGDFLDGEIEAIQKGSDVVEVYIVELEKTVVGFGVIQYGRVLPDIASIGMYVREAFRGQGIATNILYRLKELVERRGAGLFPAAGITITTLKRVWNPPGPIQRQGC